MAEIAVQFYYWYLIQHKMFKNAVTAALKNILVWFAYLMQKRNLLMLTAIVICIGVVVAYLKSLCLVVVYDLDKWYLAMPSDFCHSNNVYKSNRNRTVICNVLESHLDLLRNKWLVLHMYIVYIVQIFCHSWCVLCTIATLYIYCT